MDLVSQLWQNLLSHSRSEVGMLGTKFSSRELDQNTGRVRIAAQQGPVVITNRGRLAYVLMTIEDYRKLPGVKLVGPPEQ